mmetsp:Transcript_5130/g.12273  ORF Transcript_5130/g.12273 Transcript_5130/m.12273 type:complete len:250 (+) Transcript_5130:90-839(+)
MELPKGGVASTHCAPPYLYFNRSRIFCCWKCSRRWFGCWRHCSWRNNDGRHCCDRNCWCWRSCLWSCFHCPNRNGSPLAGLPSQAQSLQFGDTSIRDGCLFAISLHAVLLALAVNPLGQFNILRIVARNIAMSVFLAVVLEFLYPLFPNGFVLIPCKAQLFQFFNAGICHGRLFAFLPQLVVLSLGINPISQRSVGLVALGDGAIPVLVSVLFEFVQSLLPVGIENTRVPAVWSVFSTLEDLGRESYGL